MKDPKIGINFSIILKYLSTVALAIMITIFALLLIFIYINVYKTMASVEIITDLRQRIAEEELQSQKFQDIEEIIKTKNQKSNLNYTNIKNSFRPLE